MYRMKMYDMIILGQMMKDRIVLRNETVTAIGGAAYYAGFVAQRLGLRTAIITKLAQADNAMLDEFRNAGIDVFPVYDTLTSSIELTYPTGQPDKRTAKFLSIANPFLLADMPDIKASVVHLCPLLRGEISLDIVKRFRSMGDIVSLDVQGFMRGAAEGGAMLLTDWEEKAEGLRGVDIVKVDDVEAEILTGTSDLYTAMEMLASYGPKEIVLTYKHGVMAWAEGFVYESPFTSKRFRGRTGRGDTTIGAYLSRRLTHSPRDACRFAAALASLKMEQHGPFCHARQDVENLLRKRGEVTHPA